MSKEKTRAELHAEVADLKAKVDNRDKVIAETRAKYVEADKSFNEQLKLYAALKEEHEACEKSLERADKVIDEMNAEIERLEKREKYLEGELKEKTELNEKQGERIQKYSENIERIRADRDKYMYLANNMLEHGVFNFLIVKYRNLKSK